MLVCLFFFFSLNSVTQKRAHLEQLTLFYFRNRNFTAGIYITLIMLWFRNIPTAVKLICSDFSNLWDLATVFSSGKYSHFIWPRGSWKSDWLWINSGWFCVFLRYPLMSTNLKGVYCTTGECTLKSVLDLVANLVALLFCSANNVKQHSMGLSPAGPFTK